MVLKGFYYQTHIFATSCQDTREGTVYSKAVATKIYPTCHSFPGLLPCLHNPLNSLFLLRVRLKHYFLGNHSCSYQRVGITPVITSTHSFIIHITRAVSGSSLFFFFFFPVGSMHNMGLELTTPKSRVICSPH